MDVSGGRVSDKTRKEKITIIAGELLREAKAKGCKRYATESKMKRLEFKRMGLSGEAVKAIMKRR